MKVKSLILIIALAGFSTAQSGEFGDLVASFGTTRTVAGIQHAITSNPDGTGINFWSASSEGSDANGVGLSNPHIAAGDAYGNIYIADKASHSILKITRDGRIHTWAGKHVAGFNGDGPAAATDLLISNPNGLFVLPDGTVYLLDPGNHRIRRVDLHGMMTTVVNDPASDWAPSGRARWVSPNGQLIYYTHEFAAIPPAVIADGATIKQWTATGGIQTVCDKSVGFRNPGNIAVNPVNGKLYVTDRAEEDPTKMAMGLFRIDGPNQRTRMTGDAKKPSAKTGALAVNSFIAEPGGIAFRFDGSFFICGHTDGNVWFIDTQGILHNFLSGTGKKDGFKIADGLQPPLIDKNYFAQPRAVTLSPNGNLIVVSNDSGRVFEVSNVQPKVGPEQVTLNVQSLNNIQLQWTGVVGAGYRVERSSELQPANWVAIGATGGGGLDRKTVFIDERAAGFVRGFYRILPAL